MSEPNPPLLWVLDFLAPSFRIFGQEVTLTGDLLIASRQVWSLLYGETVRSVFIGPGVVKGQVPIKGNPVDFEFLIGTAIFDPTELRPGEPVPLLDIIYPEIVDPLEQTTPEQVQEIIRTLVVKKGSVVKPPVHRKEGLSSGRILTLSPEGDLPRTIIVEEHMVTHDISFISGMNKARFLLGGQKSRLYVPFKEALLRNRFSDSSRLWTFRIDNKQFDPFDSSQFQDWVLIEMQADALIESPGTSQLIDEEFALILKYLLANQDYYVF